MKMNFKNRIMQIFMLLCGLLLSIITIVGMSKPQNNLIPGKMVLYTLFWLGVLAIAKLLLLQAEKVSSLNNRKNSGILFLVFSILFGVFLFWCGCMARSTPHTDYGEVFRAAYNMANDEQIDNWTYFARWTNNRFVMLWICGLLKLGYALGLQDAFYFMLFVQVLHVLLQVFCLYYLAGKKGKHWFSNAWMVVIIFALLTPVWGNISVFYSDQCCFGFGIFAYTLYYKGIESKKISRCIAFSVVAGVIWGLGFELKVTVFISFIALVIGVFFQQEQKRKWFSLGCVFVSFLLVVGIISGILKRLPCEKDMENCSAPITYWIALGLNESGTYADNEAFAIECLASSDMQERKDVAWRVIREDWRNFFDGEHLVKKARVVFGSGDLGASGFLRFPLKENNIIYRFFSYDGDMFWKYACVSTSYLFAIFLYGAIGAFYSLVRKEERDDTITIAYIAVVGIVLFLMLWEAQNKQLFNHSAWLCLSALCGTQAIQGVYDGRSKKNAAS